LQVVLNDKPASDEFKIDVGLGKGQGFTHETADTLAKGVVPTILMSGQTSFLANKMMGTLWEDSFISLPEIAVSPTATVSTRNGLPQPTTTVSTTVTKYKGDNLAHAATQGGPQPDGVILALDEGLT
jgi:hypothetical protein